MPSIHWPTVIYFSFDVCQALFDEFPADVDITAIEPVMVDRDCVLL